MGLNESVSESCSLQIYLQLSSLEKKSVWGALGKAVSKRTNVH